MLTSEARHDRMWAAFPALAEILAGKSIPDHYYGPSSVSDNIFNQVQRLMIIAILIQENLDTIKDKLTSDTALADDICKLVYALDGMARQFNQDQNSIIEGVLPQIEGKLRKIREQINTDHDGTSPNYANEKEYEALQNAFTYLRDAGRKIR